jgi:hypothetical protein
MAIVPKNGYSYTGYTEPFICPTGATIANGAALSVIAPVQFVGVVGAVPLEFTEFKNAGLYVYASETASAVASFASKTVNFDGQARMDTGHGIFVLDIGGVFCEVSDVTYDVSTNLYTVFVTNTPDVVSGEAYRVVGRIPDTNSAVASQDYVAGEKVIEIYP